MAIDLAEELGQVRDWGISLNLSYPILLDSDYSVWNLYGMGYIPHNVLIDTAMKVLYTNYGYAEELLISMIEDYYSPVYSKNVSVSAPFMQKDIDELTIISEISNSDNHALEVFGLIHSLDSTYRDTIPMFDDGAHGDGDAGDKIFGSTLAPISQENDFMVGVMTTDLDYDVTYSLEAGARFTTIGPIVYESFAEKLRIQNRIYIDLYLRNNGSDKTAKDISAQISTNDPYVTGIAGNIQLFGDIEAGQTVKSQGSYGLMTSDLPDEHTINFEIEIFSSGKLFWTDNTDIVVGIESDRDLAPMKFALHQNYPNPFNPETVIKYSLDNRNPLRTRLNIYNSLGQLIRTLFDDMQAAGDYRLTWDGKDETGSDVASGIYYYELISGDRRALQKMILMR